MKYHYDKELLEELLDRLDEPFELNDGFVVERCGTFKTALNVVFHKVLINIRKYTEYCIGHNIDLEQEKEFIMDYLSTFFREKYGVEEDIDIKATLSKQAKSKGYNSTSDYMHKKWGYDRPSDFFQLYKYLTYNDVVLKDVCDDLGIDLAHANYSFLRLSWDKYVDKKIKEQKHKKA